MTDSGAKREQNPHYGLYNGLSTCILPLAHPAIKANDAIGSLLL